ncbi:putative dehydrogenase [Crossiella equi]|uniref:Dehydrogenase n=1 Tax=Crossiella equi TaxID=130796 RepID=A0ABS5AR75_9PSEU|nr:Gfo/Idh/MocA family oxidoreductase [Crossiella equi]MBP2479063.1 putative dehydrogenase [Crossiella equi]
MNTTVLAGAGGYGLRHLRELLSLRDRVELVGLVDPSPSEQARRLAPGCPWYPSLAEALAARPVDSVVIATPPHTHFDLARTAIGAGSSVYLEKPPVTLLRDLDELAALPARRVEVGFQQARTTVEALHRGWLALGAPEVEWIAAYGALSRPERYYHRGRWAGEWFLDGQAVLDGPLFNPLAHVVQAALLFARRVQPSWAPARVTAECFQARRIGGDDTSALRVTCARGLSVLAVGTTATDVVVPPAVLVRTAAGELHVTDGGRRVLANVPVLPAPEPVPALHRAVTDPRGEADPLLSLASARDFVLTANAAVQVARTPSPVPATPRPSTRDGLPVVQVDGLGRLVSACARRGALLSEVDPAWAGSARSLLLDGYAGLVHPELALA